MVLIKNPRKKNGPIILKKELQSMKMQGWKWVRWKMWLNLTCSNQYGTDVSFAHVQIMPTWNPNNRVCIGFGVKPKPIYFNVFDTTIPKNLLPRDIQENRN